jgi:hypothetical protein
LVGDDTDTVEGTIKPTLYSVPATFVTVLAGKVIAEPPAVGVRVTVTVAGVIVPVGNPLPRSVMFVMPGCPEDGVTEVRVTEAAVASLQTFNAMRMRIEASRKDFLNKPVEIRTVHLRIPYIGK